MEKNMIGKNAEIMPPVLLHNKKFKNVNFQNVYENISSKFLKKDVRSSLIKIVHNVVPTKIRKFKIGIVTNDKCDQCKKADSVIHRLTCCNESKKLYEYLCEVIEKVTGNKKKIPLTHLMYYDLFQLRPPEIHAAVLWLMANYVHAVLFKKQVKKVCELKTYYKNAWSNVNHEKVVSKNIGNALNANMF